MPRNHIANIRKSVIRMTHRSRSSHVGSCLSACDILYVLYFRVLNIDPRDPANKDRDKFVLSKAHASAALYATLGERGFFPLSHLEKFYIDDGILPGHLDREAVPGVEVSAGSLGHGLPIGVGMALANRQTGSTGRIYVLLGDGECNEGSVWEAAMLAATLRLSNLTAIVDMNKLQGFGRTDAVIDQRNMAERWRAFGWDVLLVDGHDVEALENALKGSADRPRAVIAETVKGKGVCFMEDQLEWHYRSPNDEQCREALRELERDL